MATARYALIIHVSEESAQAIEDFLVDYVRRGEATDIKKRIFEVTEKAENKVSKTPGMEYKLLGISNEMSAKAMAKRIVDLPFFPIGYQWGVSWMPVDALPDNSTEDT